MKTPKRQPILLRDDRGFTLVETLVATGILMLFLVMAMTTVMSVSRATTATRQMTSINEQARLATERLARELRQAWEIQAVELPNSSSEDLTMTIGIDFNDNRRVDEATELEPQDQPEILTYHYDAALGRLTLTADNGAGESMTRPILSSDVSNFIVAFRSSLWQYDGKDPFDPVKDGVTDWTELDAGGNNNDVLDEELKSVDLVEVTLTVLEGARQQTYTTQVSLRNRAQT